MRVGAVEHADSLGHRTIVQPGDALVMSAGAGIRHSQRNASSQWLDHHRQMWLQPRQSGTPPASDWRRFAPDDHVGRWQLIASDDGRENSLTIDQDALLWRARTAATAPLRYPLRAERSLYLHAIAGETELTVPAAPAVERLSAGDAVVWRQAQAFGLRCVGPCGADFLLVDLPPHRDRTPFGRTPPRRPKP